MREGRERWKRDEEVNRAKDDDEASSGASRRENAREENDEEEEDAFQRHDTSPFRRAATKDQKEKMPCRQLDGER